LQKLHNCDCADPGQDGIFFPDWQGYREKDILVAPANKKYGDKAYPDDVSEGYKIRPMGYSLTRSVLNPARDRNTLLKRPPIFK